MEQKCQCKTKYTCSDFPVHNIILFLIGFLTEAIMNPIWKHLTGICIKIGKRIRLSSKMRDENCEKCGIEIMKNAE